MMDASAFYPETNIYVHSNLNSGYYMQMNKCQDRGLLFRLNSLQPAKDGFEVNDALNLLVDKALEELK
jgi:hypothetical protein